eukprot:scaffold2707_cov417-Prasinococcus_capsulatus_cf.AAC.23
MDWAACSAQSPRRVRHRHAGTRALQPHTLYRESRESGTGLQDPRVSKTVPTCKLRNIVVGHPLPQW